MGGAHIGGDAHAGRDFIGRDQINNITNNAVSLFFLDPMNMASDAIRHTLGANAGSLALVGVRAELIALVDELRATHKAIVELVNPLWSIADDPATFAAEFRRAYAHFRRRYDALDFGAQRTHCSRLRAIHQDLEHKRRSLDLPISWDQMDAGLRYLYNADMDVIEQYYRPFTAWLNDAMKTIYQFVNQEDIASAIAAKQALLNALEPRYDENKRKLEEMNDLIASLSAGS
ncbi:MAG: hypothetical protein RMN52_04065 [Anaerolineae bacterium]|nr:hypothetical protein [Candidatus Roseilinea sp.]MDW8449158.1 hypothetical protein [Anaerolineae bacterium]